MKVIVGLGNPGSEYKNTHHNVGFIIIDYMIDRLKLAEVKKFNTKYARASINGEEVLLVKPQLYMNLSGEPIREITNYFKVPLDNVLIIVDDMDLPFGKIKLKYKGSCGGHNGLRNIENNFATQDYKRLKYGISRNSEVSGKDYVLSRLSNEERETLTNDLPKMWDIINDFVELPFDKVMSKYN